MAKCSLIAGIAGKCQSSRWVNLIYNRAESHSFGANTCKLQVGSGKLQPPTCWSVSLFLFLFAPVPPCVGLENIEMQWSTRDR